MDNTQHGSLTKKLAASKWAIITGIALRVALLLVSTGCDDIRIWEKFAHSIDSRGLRATYALESSFNHPPAAGLFALGVLKLSTWVEIPFPYVFKFFSLLADVGILILMSACQLGEEAPRAAKTWLYALSPPSVLISAYHGNTDPICVLFLVLSVWLSEMPQKAVWAGAALGLATNIKIIPLILVPVMLATLPSNRSRFRFAVGLAVACLPIAAGLFALGATFVQNVFEYRSNLEAWGINFFLWQIAGAPETYAKVGGGVTILAVVLLGAAQGFRRLLTQWQAAFVTLALFLVLAPGFGVQYLIYVTPFLVGMSLVASTPFLLLSGIFLGLNYLSFMTSYWPLTSFHGYSFARVPAFFGALTWLCLAYLLMKRVQMRGFPDGRERQVDAEYHKVN